jgi:hypothetical protein
MAGRLSSVLKNMACLGEAGYALLKIYMSFLYDKK